LGQAVGLQQYAPIKLSVQIGSRAGDISFDNAVQLCEALGYLVKNVDHIDGEYPEGSSGGNMAITDGTTSGGNPMKYGREWRIYLKTTTNCPPKISEKLHADAMKRFGGSKFVEALLQCGFIFGPSQNIGIIKSTINSIFSATAEIDAFNRGYNIVP
jgi:hypothetical protein